MTVKEAIEAQKELIKSFKEINRSRYLGLVCVAYKAEDGLKVIEKELKELQKELDKAHKRYQDFANLF